jgi:adenylate cyclase
VTELEELEHERRFLVADTSVIPLYPSYEIMQGYLWASEGYAVRVRVSCRTFNDDGRAPEELKAFLTLKGPRLAASRFEKEMEIPSERASALIKIAPHRIRKTRHTFSFGGQDWEVDVFHDANEGLVLAEFESTADAVARLQPPPWCGAEVTDDPRYNNENLAASPWPQWSRDGGLG